MTTYQQQIEKALSEDVIPSFWLGYFREAFREAINDQLLELYRAASTRGINKKIVAQKLGRRPEQITRWLAAPNNLEADTISDLALALGCVPVFGLEKIGRPLPKSQQRHPLSERIEIEASQGYLKRVAPATGSATADALETL